ncbi:hypothetical protein SDC9_133771 [bioreactor metagenome]|uniref:Uncharacterized protein n=1 Tax=bioreactor metagenome TaxID=1076179 RepID=A0A645DB51_9ZZZZ
MYGFDTAASVAATSVGASVSATVSVAAGVAVWQALSAMLATINRLTNTNSFRIFFSSTKVLVNFY